jgi:hypothetical protein
MRADKSMNVSPALAVNSPAWNPLRARAKEPRLFDSQSTRAFPVALLMS